MKDALDDIDFALIGALQKNGRATNKELCDVVGLAPSTVHTRLRHLETSGAIRGYTAQADPAQLGIGLQVLVFLGLRHNSGPNIDALWRKLMARPEVIACYHLGGEDDLLLQVAARDTEHLRDGVLDFVSRQPEVGRVRTELLFRAAKAPLPHLCQSAGSS